MFLRYTLTKKKSPFYRNDLDRKPANDFSLVIELQLFKKSSSQFEFEKCLSHPTSSPLFAARGTTVTVKKKPPIKPDHPVSPPFTIISNVSFRIQSWVGSFRLNRRCHCDRR
ncbi:hypothetical protein TNIN_350161 [Trichonephila inaurata madagascariensis]|uniref:Uncharacterized protein n=1 Tax=Trichonephila inaurata madagascariensis TaxID=2747483 RepID=A0A8X6YQU4_9ARAC|nr:hypothetical protein TNIN_350161 [Trichonephila inaurata madagascariensis]